MASERVTVTLNSATREGAQRHADAAGVSLSAYINRAVRRQMLGDSMRAEAAYLAANPDAAALAAERAEQDEAERETARAAERTVRRRAA